MELTNRNFLQRYKQIKDYVEQWDADALVIHSVKSCRLFSAGQGDMREYFTKELECADSVDRIRSGRPAVFLRGPVAKPRGCVL